MILSKKHSVVIADFYCDEPVECAQADVIRYNQWSSPVPGDRMAPFHTILIDLTLPLEQVLAGCEKGTRYDIRRAQKENLIVEVFSAPTLEVIETFCDAYNSSVAVKGLPLMEPSTMLPAAGAAVLEISCIRQESEQPLAWHVYCWGNNRPALQYSVSVHRTATDGAARQLIGRANRLLHWRDLVRFKEQGVTVLDMGGWYGGSEDEELLKVNKFKEEFGGRISEVYNSIHGVTLKGKGALRLLALKRLF